MWVLRLKGFALCIDYTHKLRRMNTTAENNNETIDYVSGNDSTVTKEEDLSFRIFGLYLPLAFRLVLMFLVIYLVLTAIDAIVITRKRHAQRLNSIEFSS